MENEQTENQDNEVSVNLDRVNPASAVITAALNHLTNAERGVALAHSVCLFYGKDSVEFYSLVTALIPDVLDYMAKSKDAAEKEVSE